MPKEIKEKIIEQLKPVNIPIQKQVDLLAQFLMENFGNEIKDEGAVEMAVRLLMKLKCQKKKQKRKGRQKLNKFN